MSFIVGQTSATIVAMTSNFLLNNFLTYYDMRLRCWQMLRGWVSFTLACSIGALANIWNCDLSVHDPYALAPFRFGRSPGVCSVELRRLFLLYLENFLVSATSQARS